MVSNVSFSLSGSKRSSHSNAYFYGFFMALTVYWTLHTIFPVPRQTGSSPFVLAEHVQMLEGEQSRSSISEVVDVQPAKYEV